MLFDPSDFKAPAKPKIINPTTDLDWDEKGQLHRITREQQIPQEFLDQNRRMFEDSKNRRSGENEVFARIPTVVYYAWLDEGFDPDEHTDEEVIARLRRDELDFFITSSKIGGRAPSKKAPAIILPD